MIIQSIPEGSGATLTASFFDADGAPATPVSIQYSIWCLTNGQEIRASTALSVGQAVQITIEPSDTAILGAGNSDEIKQVTVRANYGAADQFNQIYQFSVTNIQGIS